MGVSKSIDWSRFVPKHPKPSSELLELVLELDVNVWNGTIKDALGQDATHIQRIGGIPYRKVIMQDGHRLTASHIIWYHYYKEWPTTNIYYRDGDGTNIKLANLTNKVWERPMFMVRRPTSRTRLKSVTLDELQTGDIDDADT